MLSHLHEHKFKHSFYDTLKCSCSGGLDIETAPHCFFHYPFVNFSWMMYSPEYYELNWWYNINQKQIICYPCCALWKRLFQRWGKLAYFECSYWIYSFYENNWWPLCHFWFTGLFLSFCFHGWKIESLILWLGITFPFPGTHNTNYARWSFFTIYPGIFTNVSFHRKQKKPLNPSLHN